MRRILAAAGCWWAAAGALGGGIMATNHLTVYIGAYTGAGSQGIYAAEFDPVQGVLGRPELAAKARNPTFLAAHPGGRWIYAVSEIENFGGGRTGAVSAFAREPGSRRLRPLNQQPSGGAGPCHLSLDRSGRVLLVANYSSGSVAALPIGPDGALGAPASVIQHRGASVDPARQKGPHAHFIAPDPANRLALACDLGLDRILVYRLDVAAAALAPHQPPCGATPPGSGPRHLVFFPDARFIWVINEMACTISTFALAADTGALRLLETIPSLPRELQAGDSGAEIALDPAGRWLYCSNRGHDSLCWFRIDPSTGKLAWAGQASAGGRTPRHFAFSPDGGWVLASNQDSDHISIFRVDKATGKLAPAGVSAPISKPVCVLFQRP